MSNSVLLDKSKALALDVIKLCNEVKTNKKASILTNQLVRSGTIVGANIREAFYAHGKADFIARLHIALKEYAESEYWLELLLDGGYTENKVGSRKGFCEYVCEYVEENALDSALERITNRIRNEGIEVLFSNPDEESANS